MLFRSVIDHLEIEREKAGEWPRGMRMTESDLWVVSWLGMPMYDADFRELSLLLVTTSMKRAIGSREEDLGFGRPQ